MNKTSYLLLLIGFILTSLYILEKIYYRDRIEFLSPLEMEDLLLRSDEYGDGHFAAERKNGRFHKGVDILAPVGMPVRAAKNGWAIEKFDRDGYGKYVKIYHDDGLMTLYAHLEDKNIKWFKKVRQGDIIGWVGKTGNARYKGVAAHLHFEVREGGVPVDPMRGYLR